MYELDGERYLFVFDPADPNMGGKGDIYPAEAFHRFVRWRARVSEEHVHGRGNSVSHWAYYSALKHQLVANIDTLIDQLRSTMARTQHDLDLSYQKLRYPFRVRGRDRRRAGAARTLRSARNRCSVKCSGYVFKDVGR